MENEKMKNMIVLKNLPSNIVEEAIVVLKKNKVKQYKSDLENENINENINSTNKKMRTNEYILKEAEMVISDYISNIEKKSGKKQNIVNAMEKKYKRLKITTICMAITLIAVIILRF